MSNCFHCAAPLSEGQTACFQCHEPHAVRDAWIEATDAAIAALTPEKRPAKVLAFRPSVDERPHRSDVDER